MLLPATGSALVPADRTDDNDGCYHDDTTGTT